jgi:uncharacterized protein (DUF302 family)
MSIALTATTALDVDAADARVRELLAEQGFGVLTEIDVQATLRAKLGVEVPAYRILGACNPALAHEALGHDPEIGLLLPCNVTVRATDAGTVVQAMDPGLMVDVTGKPVLEDVASRARALLGAALAGLA